MRKHIGMILLAVSVVAALLFYTVTFTVDQYRDIVLIKRFGKIHTVYSGAEDAGLKYKLPYPIEKVIRYDARQFFIESAQVQVMTRDQQSVLISTFCTWRIADPSKFHQAVKTLDRAQQELRTKLQAKTGDVLGRYDLQYLINTDPAKMQLRQIEDDILGQLKAIVEDAYGLEVAMVGIRSWGLPEGVSMAVIDLQKKDREKDAQDFRTRGEAEATAIKARAKAASEKILAFANRKAAEIRSEGDRAAAQIYQHFSRNPQLSAFLRSLESLKIELESRSVILLDGSELPAVKYFRTGPIAPSLERPLDNNKGRQ